MPEGEISVQANRGRGPYFGAMVRGIGLGVVLQGLLLLFGFVGAAQRFQILLLIAAVASGAFLCFVVLSLRNQKILFAVVGVLIGSTVLRAILIVFSAF